eukprot:scaffold10181_cov190-Chaetoceros_neogracile.AAC.1
MKPQGRRKRTVDRRRKKSPRNKAEQCCGKRSHCDPCCGCRDDTTYQNDFNTSNHVPPQDVLRMKLHSSFPILYLPEYIARRNSSVPDDMETKYRNVLAECSCRNRQNKQSRCGKVEQNHSNSSEANDDGSKSKMELLDVLVRIIVIPLHVSIISLVSHPTLSSSKSNKVTEKNDVAPTSSKHENTSMKNCYKKPITKRKFNDISQHLDVLTDGVISTLVHQKKQFSNHPCHGMNLLSEGYKLSSGGYQWRAASNSHSSSAQKKRRISRNTNSIGVINSTGSECPNMRPGVEMTGINPCASYARSSPEMRLLHEIMGDDAMRELLLKGILLIPISTSTSTGKGETDFTNGNYFQLCGPPLNLMKLKLRPSDFSHISLDHHGATKVPGDVSQAPTMKADPFFCIPRHRMLYADTYSKHVGLPPRHLLNQTDVTALELRLLNCMTNENRIIGNERMKGLKRLRERGVEICTQIIKNHKNCDYHRLLQRNCPLPSSEMTKIPDLETLISHRSQTTKVVSFFKSVLKKLFPFEFWGSAHNFGVVLKGIDTFLSMRKNEQLSIKHIMQGIRILDIKWLFKQKKRESSKRRPKTEHEAATRVAETLMKWMYCHFLIPLGRSTFYCTDTEFSGNEIVYYRKPVWAQIRTMATKKLQCQFKQVDHGDMTKTLTQTSLGCSGLRLLPKTNGGIRPIALLCKEERSLRTFYNIDPGPSRRLRGTNQGLKEVFKALSFEHRHSPELFGVGVHGFHEVHKKLLSFVQMRRGSSSELYFASVDIHHCYDNINQPHLLKLVDKILSKNEYASQECTILSSCDGKSRLMQKKEKSIGSPGNVKSFLEQATAIADRHNHAVFVDKVRCKIASKPALLSLLNEHLSRNLVVLKDQFAPQLLLQTSGIPQGSILSSLLCNYYYGDIESHLFEGIFDDALKDQHLIIRVVDDFILITSDKKTSEKFVHKMKQGSSHYGVQLNEKKTRTSHEIDQSLDTSGKTSQGKMNGEGYFQWCGLLINTMNCEVQIDYNRFAGTRALDTLTINRVANEGEKFARNLQSFVRPRCTPILFDSRINSSSTMMVNFHQAIAMCAVKAVNYIVQYLDVGNNQNEHFLFQCVKDVVVFAHNLIQSRLRKLDDTIQIPVKDFVDSQDAMWLGIHAFKAVYRHTKNPNFNERTSLLAKYLKKLQPLNLLALNVVALKSLKSFDLKRFHM